MKWRMSQEGLSFTGKMKINNKWGIILDSLFQFFMFILYTSIAFCIYGSGFPLLSISIMLFAIGTLIWGIAYDVTSMKRNLVIFLNKVEEENKK